MESWMISVSTRSHTKSADALRAHITILYDAAGLWEKGLKHFHFPKMLVTPKSQKMPNHTNTRSCQTTLENTQPPNRHVQEMMHPTNSWLKQTLRAKSWVWPELLVIVTQRMDSSLDVYNCSGLVSSCDCWHKLYKKSMEHSMELLSCRNSLCLSSKARVRISSVWFITLNLPAESALCWDIKLCNHAETDAGAQCMLPVVNTLGQLQETTQRNC